MQSKYSSTLCLVMHGLLLFRRSSVLLFGLHHLAGCLPHWEIDGLMMHQLIGIPVLGLPTTLLLETISDLPTLGPKYSHTLTSSYSHLHVPCGACDVEGNNNIGLGRPLQNDQRCSWFLDVPKKNKFMCVQWGPCVPLL